MHLGLLDRPFLLHNLISSQNILVPLLKFQMVTRLIIIMASGSKTGIQIFFSFTQKSRQTNPLQVPQQGPYGERYPFAGHFASCCTGMSLVRLFIPCPFSLSIFYMKVRKEISKVSISFVMSVYLSVHKCHIDSHYQDF